MSIAHNGIPIVSILCFKMCSRKRPSSRGLPKAPRFFEDKQFKLIDDCLRSRAWGPTWPENGFISVDTFLCNHSSSFQHLCHLCLFVWILNLYDICKRFGSLVENKKKIEPHKVILINNIAMVTYVFNKLLPLVFNMNTLVSYYS